MNRLLQIVNLFGVLAMGALCIVQWRDNGQLHTGLDSLERTRQERVSKIAEQDKTIQGFTSDLDDVRNKLSKSDAALKEAQGKLATDTAAHNQLVTARDQLAAERDQLKAALEKWNAAVAQRDEALKQAGGQIQKLLSERNDAVGRFNELATKYNGAVKELNARAAAGH